MLGRLLGQSLGRSVRPSVHSSVHRLVGWPVFRLVGCLWWHCIGCCGIAVQCVRQCHWGAVGLRIFWQPGESNFGEERSKRGIIH